MLTVIPTPEEERNGWTTESLSEYVSERRKVQDETISFGHEIMFPWLHCERKHDIYTQTDNNYNPLEW